jgi:hypothetical protein
MADRDSNKGFIGVFSRKKAARAPIIGLVIVPPFILWIILATDSDGNIALVRNDVLRDGTGGRNWHGAMANTTDSQYRQVSVTIRFLDSADQPVGEISKSVAALNPGESFDLQARLPPNATSMQVYSLEWETGRTNKRTDPPLGPWAPWPFGHVQANWP